jgi:sugar phosphate isomerase/epimerase
MSTSTRRDFLGSAAALTGAGLVATELSGQQPPQLPRNEPPLRFRLGIVTYNIAATWDVAALLRICGAVGLNPVELRTTHRHGVEPTLTADQRRDVRRRFQDAGIEIWGCGTVCEFHSTDQAVVRRNIEDCRRFCQLVADIGGRGVKVRPNDLPQGVAPERTIAQIGRSLRDCGRAAADAGVEIWVEVHGPRGAAHPPNVRSMMQEADHASVGVTWNSNQTDIVGGSVAEYFRLLRPWIKSCHINELHAGYPYRELFRLLRETNYDRVALAEIQGMPDEASGERLMRFYKALWTELARPQL